MEQLPANADTLLYVAAALFAAITILGRLIERLLPARPDGAKDIIGALQELQRVIGKGWAEQRTSLQQIYDAQVRLEQFHLKEDPETGLPRHWCQARHLTQEQTREISAAIERGFERVAKEMKRSA